MAKTEIPYTYIVRRKLATGKWKDYYRFRREGTDTALPGSPGDAEFHGKYSELMAREDRLAEEKAEVPRESFNWLLDQYLESMEFSLLAETTQADYRRTIERLRGPLGTERFDIITRGSIKMVRDKYKDKPRTAHKVKQMVSRIYSWADEADLVDEGFNPAARLKKPKAKVTPITIWSDEEIALFQANCEPFMLTVLLLAIHTGQRRQDLVRMTWKDFQGSIIRVRQNKTGEPLMIPCHKELRSHLDGITTRFGPIIRAADGKTMNANALSSAMNRAVAAIDNMPHRTLHGLRYASAGRMEEAGCSVVEITSIIGHRTYQMALKYMRQRKDAEAAIARLERTAS